MITNVLQLTRAARSCRELRAVRVLVVFCYFFGIGALFEREHTHRARVHSRSVMLIHIFRTVLCASHLRPLIRRDAIAIEGRRKESEGSNAKVLREIKEKIV